METTTKLTKSDYEATKKVAFVYGRTVGAVSARFELLTEETREGTLQIVRVALSDCESYNRHPRLSHEMVRLGAPEWLLSASTCSQLRKVGRGKQARYVVDFANLWRGKVA